MELPHSDHQRAGGELFHEDAAIQAYRCLYGTLADLYSSDGEALQGVILVDAHLAASAIGATPTALRTPKIDPTAGDLFIAFTSGSPDNTGGPDPAVFQGPDG